MNEFEQYFRQNSGRLIHKWTHYFEIYHRHFARFKDRDIVLLEIGVSQGGSLQMWKKYFGPKAKIYGIDINPQCKDLEGENIEIFIGSQSDRKFLREVRKAIPPIDILIDDGGHTMRQQIVSYQEMFGHVKSHGVYLCEDLHTSYWLNWGGGYRRRGTFIEYSKRFIDSLHAYHSKQRGLRVDEFTRSVDSIHYYDSVLVIEKRKRDKPTEEKTGTMSFDDRVKRSEVAKARETIVHAFIKVINITLRFFGLRSVIW